MAHSAEDCGHILNAIAGADSKDPGSAKKGFHFAPQYARPPKQLKLGFSPADFGEFADEPLRPALASALEVLRNTGIELKEINLPDLPYGPAVSTIIAAEAATIFADLIRDGRIDTLSDARQAAGLKAGLEISASDYLQAMRVRRLVQEALGALFAGVDAIVSPARYSVAPLVKDPLDRSSGASPARQGAGTRAIVSAGNLAGLPALVLPAGFAGEGSKPLPVAICLTGRPFSENMLLRLGIEFQQSTDWHRRRPVV
jgi:aspartyl-tRNA(Asn)/glutamyl-tRNA(Gln) amidotransferase subunit A